VAMKKGGGHAPSSNPRPTLTVPHSEARDQILTQIENGLGLHTMMNKATVYPDKQSSWLDLRPIQRSYRQWHDYNLEMLRALFDSDEVAREYSTWGTGVAYSPGTTLEQHTRTLRDAISDEVAGLQSIEHKLDLYERALPPVVSDRSYPLGTDIFVVHGHDEAATQSAARVIEKFGLRAIILREQPDGGRTIIEKLEEESSEVGFAVVLITPDDVGAPSAQPEETKNRARQNVIFELGFFVGSLGRRRVCVLHKGHVDIPSDYHGVIYVPMDAGDGWKLKLAGEIANAGIDVDIDPRKGL